MVYVGSTDGKVYALKASTGVLLWSYTTGGEVDSSPAVANGVVYFGSWDYNVYALNASTGALLWSYATGYQVVPSSPAVANGVVYISDVRRNTVRAERRHGCQAVGPLAYSRFIPRPPWLMEWPTSATRPNMANKGGCTR